MANSVSVGVMLFAGLFAPCVFGCFSYYPGTGNVPTYYPVAGGSSPSQSALPPIPAAVSGSVSGKYCGKNEYYNNDINRPGADIVGGIEAAPNEYPWLVRLSIDLGNNKSELCGASLIHDSWLVTGAHCAYSAATPASITAVFADVDKTTQDSGEFASTISKILIHPSYVSSSHDNDIALLKLTTPVSSTLDWTVQKICLPSSCSEGCASGTTSYITGWGTTAEGSSASSSTLKKAYVPIVDYSTCSSYYSSAGVYLTTNMMCAGYRNGGVDTCLGDSGGPLMVAENGYYKLCGITSFGLGCGRAGYYGVYTKVCQYRSWIDQKIEVN